MNLSYQLIDSGNQRKLEKFGQYVLVRPCSQALWKPRKDSTLWAQADAVFSREKDRWEWRAKRPLPKEWKCEIKGVVFKISPTDFGHLGVFPEHSGFFQEMQHLLKRKAQSSVLNLFAYSGGATLAAAQAGAKVCHVDASKPMVAWARENAHLNALEHAPIRWIIDDVFKFLKREVKRGVRYDGILLDPPTFGRGNKGEVFKIEEDIHPLLELCQQLLSEDFLFLFFTTHTPGMTPIVMQHLMSQYSKKGGICAGEMQIVCPAGFNLPCGSFAKWINT